MELKVTKTFLYNACSPVTFTTLNRFSHLGDGVFVNVNFILFAKPVKNHFYAVVSLVTDLKSSIPHFYLNFNSCLR